MSTLDVSLGRLAQDHLLAMTKASRPEITGGIIGDLTALASQEKPKHLGRGYAQDENMSGFEELRIIRHYQGL
jgi:hypothetical protein